MPSLLRRRQGRQNALAGCCAEDGVVRDYEHSGAEILSRRCRTPGGELDIVAREGDILVFVEVKRRKRDLADSPISPRQWQRLEAAATHYMMTRVDETGAVRGCRFDVAIVAGDGTARIIKNARSFDAD